jgi:hypothetical protein
MKRHVNDWVGTLKAAIPFLQMVQCNATKIMAMVGQDKALATVLHEATDIVEAAETSFNAGYGTPQTLVQELASVINRRSLENGSNTPDYILADYLSRCLVLFDDATKARAEWYGQPMKDLEFNKVIETGPKPTDYPKLDELKTNEERRAEALRNINKTAYSANLGKNAPEIVPGLKFNSIHLPGALFTVMTVNTCANSLDVSISRDGDTWQDHAWNLECMRECFETGQYWQVFTKQDLTDAQQAANDYFKTRSHWEAEALKKRQFPVGGLSGGLAHRNFESQADFEARKQHHKAETDKVLENIDQKRKQAGREIMEDIEKQTAETLHGFKKSFGYVPSDLLEQFNQTNATLALICNEGMQNTQEYKDLQKKANELAETMNKVKKEAIEKEATDKMARMVADVMRVADGFVMAAKAIQVFNKEAKEAEETRKKFEHMAKATENGQNPHASTTLDEKGFMFLTKNCEVSLCTMHGGQPWACYWAGNGWATGKQLTQTDVWAAAETRLPEKIDMAIRKMRPTP